MFTKKEPWMTTGLSISSRTKAKFLIKKQKHNVSQYRIYNTKFNQIKRSMKIQYYNTLLEKINTIWSILKSALSGSKKKKRQTQSSGRI